MVLHCIFGKGLYGIKAGKGPTGLKRRLYRRSLRILAGGLFAFKTLTIASIHVYNIEDATASD